jgi:ribosomal protein L11 methylase PrmA
MGVQKKCQLLIANISSKVIIDILPKISAHLDSGGKAILSGIVVDRKKVIEGHIRDAGFQVHNDIISEDWVCFSVYK